MFQPGSRLLPLNVQSYLVNGGPNSSGVGGRLAPSASSLHASSDHIYALVATPTPDPDSAGCVRALCMHLVNRIQI